jgi:hypothetical protein
MHNKQKLQGHKKAHMRTCSTQHSLDSRKTQAKPASTKSSLAPRIPDMTLKSKYFHADSLINQHSLTTKSTRAMKKDMLKHLKGSKFLLVKNIEPHIDFKKIFRTA